MFKNLTVVVMFFVVHDIFSQSINGSNSKDALLSSNLGIDKRMTRFSPPNIEYADNSIIDSTYFVGSGDEFMITMVDMPSIYYTGTVNQNNDLFIPDLGIANLGKINLASAKKLLNECFSRKLNKKVYISLIKTKSATVSITGKVANPGTYFESGVLRILDIIRLANNDTLPPLQTFNYREVKCINRDSTRCYDLFRYIFLGDQSQNPYIYPGDEIVLDPSPRHIFLTGEALNMLGMVPIKRNENIDSLIRMFSLSESADSENIIVQRINSADGSRLITKINMKNHDQFNLQDKDIILITQKKNYPEVMIVSVNGEVKRPGLYPIAKSMVNAKELIELAGGVTPYGNLSRAVVLRRGKGILDDYVTKETKSEVRPEISSSISSSSLKKDYSVIPLENKDVELEPEDQIFIPKTDKFVYVSGCVKKPGGIPFVKDKDQLYYIKQAGGFQSRADRANISIVTIYEKAMITRDKGEIAEGDLIVVPVSTENKQLSTVILPIFQAIVTTISVLFAIYATAKK